MRRKGGRLRGLTAVLLSVCMITGTTEAGFQVARAEVMEQVVSQERERDELEDLDGLEGQDVEEKQDVQDGREDQDGQEKQDVQEKQGGQESQDEQESQDDQDDQDNQADQVEQNGQRKQTGQNEQGNSDDQGGNADLGDQGGYLGNLKRESSQEEQTSQDEEDEDDFGDERLVFITEFEPLKVSVYEFDEKPELDILLKSFPKTLKVTVEQEITLASASNAPEETDQYADDIDVFWMCDEDYENSELDEYVFYPVPDLIGCEVAVDELPEIYVILTDAEAAEEDDGLKQDILDGADVVELTETLDGVEVTVNAEAGVLPEDVTLKVRKVENQQRTAQMQEAIETQMREEQANAVVAEMVVFDVSLWDSEGNEVQPDTTKGEIMVSFRNVDLVGDGALEELELYHFEDASSTRAEKMEAVTEDEAITCAVEHFSEFAIVMTSENVSYVAQIGSVGYDTFESALENAENGDTIQLLDDAAVEVAVTIKKSITVDLNQHTLGYTGKYAGFKVNNGADAVTVTFQNGTVKGGLSANSGTTLVVSNCLIQPDNDMHAVWGVNVPKKIQISNSTLIVDCNCKSGSGHCAFCQQGTSSSTILENSTFINKGSWGHAVYFYAYAGNSQVDSCAISQEGSSNLTGNALYIYGLLDGGNVSVKNTEISSVNDATVCVYYSTTHPEAVASISFGEGNTITGQVSIPEISNPAYAVSITGGRFASEPPFDAPSKCLNLTGGEFKTDVTSYTANGYTCIKDTSGTDGYIYKVVQADGSGPVYTLGENLKQYYSDLDTALAQTEASGDTIYVETDTEITDLNRLSGRVIAGAGLGTVTYQGTLSEFLVGAGTAQLNGVNLTSSDIALTSVYADNGSLTGGAGFTKENYAAYGSLLAEGYLIDSYSFEIKPQSQFAAKIGYLGAASLNSAVLAATRNDSSSAQVNDEIVLLQDTAGDILVYQPYATFTVDLNGYTINKNSTSKQGVLIDSTADHTNITLKNGTINGTNFGVVTNGTLTDVTLNLENVNINADNYAMYLPANGSTTISGGTIVGGQTGIEIRGGTLDVDGAVISGTGSFWEAANGGGTTTGGVGLAVVQHTTKHPIDVTLSNCTINGTENAVRQRDLQENHLDNVNVTILSGTYLSDTGKAAVYSENVTGFLFGGTYSDDPDAAYIAEGYESIENADGTYTVRKPAAAGSLLDGNAAVAVDAAAVTEPEKPNGLSDELEAAFDASAEAAKTSVMAIGANTAMAGEGSAVSNLAKAVAENGILDTVLKTRLSLEQQLTDSEFETVTETNAAGEVVGIQVLPKSLTFEVTAFMVHLDEDGNELADTWQEVDLSSSRMGRQIPFTFRFPVPSAVTAIYANVEHEGDPVTQYRIEGNGDGKYITVSVWHLSQFKLTFTNEYLTASGDDTETPAPDNSIRTSGSGGSDSDSGAGYWIQDEKGWWYRKADGSCPKDCWFACGWNGRTDWYHFDEEGYMDDGWFVDVDGHIYFLHNVSDNTRGHMYVGWHLIDGNWYYFNPFAGSLLGALFTGGMTPDGYMVNEKGQWIS